jgi:hypothetical protein
MSRRLETSSKVGAGSNQKARARASQPFEGVIRNAYYIKLGAGGQWAESSVRDGVFRFGWRNTPIGEIRKKDWNSIRARLSAEHTNKGTVTADLARLKDIVTSTIDDVWITFHDSRMWWCRLGDTRIHEDETSRYRIVSEGWSDRDTSGRLLITNRLPGRIAQLQGFRGTACSVKDKEGLRRVLAAEDSEVYKGIAEARRRLAVEIAAAVQRLHWKDFEILVDLIFRQAGWRRRSVLGKTMKYVDLELVEPMTDDAYQVQIKSRADVSDFDEYVAGFSNEGFRRLYFVVHSPTPALAKTRPQVDEIELVLPDRVADLVIDHGLVGWVLDRVR